MSQTPICSSSLHKIQSRLEFGLERISYILFKLNMHFAYKLQVELELAHIYLIEPNDIEITIKTKGFTEDPNHDCILKSRNDNHESRIKSANTCNLNIR